MLLGRNFKKKKPYLFTPTEHRGNERAPTKFKQLTVAVAIKFMQMHAKPGLAGTRAAADL